MSEVAFKERVINLLVETAIAEQHKAEEIGRKADGSLIVVAQHTAKMEICSSLARIVASMDTEVDRKLTQADLERLVIYVGQLVSRPTLYNFGRQASEWSPIMRYSNQALRLK